MSASVASRRVFPPRSTEGYQPRPMATLLENQPDALFPTHQHGSTRYPLFPVAVSRDSRQCEIPIPVAFHYWQSGTSYLACSWATFSHSASQHHARLHPCHVSLRITATPGMHLLTSSPLLVPTTHAYCKIATTAVDLPSSSISHHTVVCTDEVKPQLWQLLLGFTTSLSPLDCDGAYRFSDVPLAHCWLDRAIASNVIHSIVHCHAQSPCCKSSPHSREIRAYTGSIRFSTRPTIPGINDLISSRSQSKTICLTSYVISSDATSETD